jgi:hypothetical protein
MAQDRFSLGPKFGILQSELTANWDSIKSAADQHFEVGLFARFSGKVFYFQPELMYLTEGGIVENEAHTIKEEVLIQSLDIPLIFGLKLGSDKFNFHVNGGPVFNIPVNKTIETKEGTSLLQEEDISDFSTSVQAGAGIDFLFMILDFRYEYALTDLYQGSGTTSGLVLENSNFNISLAFKLL